MCLILRLFPCPVMAFVARRISRFRGVPPHPQARWVVGVTNKCLLSYLFLTRYRPRLRGK